MPVSDSGTNADKTSVARTAHRRRKSIALFLFIQAIRMSLINLCESGLVKPLRHVI